MNGGMGGGRGGFDGLPGGGQFPVLSEDIQPGEEDTAQEETTQSQEASQGRGTGRTPPSVQSPPGEAPAGEEAGSLSEESLTTPEAGGAAGERAQAPESGGNQTPPGFSEDTGQGGGPDGFPDGQGGQESGQLLLLAGSALVLAIGLLIAALYRKRA